MRGTPGLLWFTALALMASGCVSNGEPIDGDDLSTASEDTPLGRGGNGTDPARDGEGDGETTTYNDSTDPDNADAAPANSGASADTPTEVIIPISGDGTLTAGQACSPVGCTETLCAEEACPFTSDRTTVVDLGKRVDAIHLEAEWTASAPTTEELILFLIVCDPSACADDTASRFEVVVGASPLSLDATDIVVPEGEKLAIGMNTPSGGVSIGQDFTIRGQASHFGSAAEHIAAKHASARHD